jgi:hypothetical protein
VHRQQRRRGLPVLTARVAVVVGNALLHGGHVACLRRHFEIGEHRANPCFGRCLLRRARDRDGQRCQQASPRENPDRHPMLIDGSRPEL